MLSFVEQASIDVRSSDDARLAHGKKKRKNLPGTLRIPSLEFRARGSNTSGIHYSGCRAEIESERKFLGYERQPQPRSSSSSFAAAFFHTDGHCLVIHRVTEGRVMNDIDFPRSFCSTSFRTDKFATFGGQVKMKQS